MLQKLFAQEPPLDEASTNWIFQVKAWAGEHLDPAVFQGQRILVKPNNEHFPGRENSLEGMAGLILGKVIEHAGMQHWPLRLASPGQVQALPEMGGQGIPTAPVFLDYDPQLVGNPEGLIAHFAHLLAHHLASKSQQPPPGGLQNWPQTTELLTVFMGFGLMTVNSAHNFRPPSCGSGGCGGAGAQRQSFLSQYDLTYALALFAHSHDIPRSEVLGSLKSSLKGFFKKSLKDVARRSQSGAVSTVGA